MQSCRCALCGTNASGDGLTAFIHSIDYPSCGTFDVTAGTAWLGTPGRVNEGGRTAKAPRRDARTARALSREDIMRAAGVR